MDGVEEVGGDELQHKNRSLVSAIVERFWLEDPWKRQLAQKGRMGFSAYSPSLVRLTFLGSVGSIIAAIGGATSTHGIAGLLEWVFFGLVGSLGTLLLGTRIPSYELASLDVLDLAPGHLYCEPTLSRQDSGVNVGHVVLAVFQHHGRIARPVQVALDDGSGRHFPLDETVFILIERDLFSNFRPDESADLPFWIEATTDGLAILAVLWDEHVAGKSKVLRSELDELLKEWDQARVGAALAQVLKMNVALASSRGFGRNQVGAYELSAAGQIVLTAALRDQGVELFRDAEEKRMTNIENYGIYFQDSPGAAGVVGGGTAKGSASGGLSPHVVEAIQRLLNVEFDQFNQFTEEQSQVLAGLQQALKSQMELKDARQADVGELRRAITMIGQIAGGVVVGAMGSGTWAMLSAWAGM